MEQVGSYCGKAGHALSPLISVDVPVGDGCIWNATWNHSGSVLAVCGSDRVIRLFAFNPKDLSLALSDELGGGHTRTIRSVSFSPSDTRLSAASFDSTVSIWHRAGGGDGRWTCLANLEGHENEVKSSSWSSDGRYLATCGRDKTVWIWECSEDEPDEFECAAVLAEHLQDVKMVRWHPFEHILLSASYDDTVRIWICDHENDEWFCAAELTAHASTVWAIDFSPDGTHFVSASDDQCLVIWRRDFTKRLVFYEPIQRIWNAHTRTVYSVSWLDNYHRSDESGLSVPGSQAVLASGSGDKSIAVWCAPIDESASVGDFELSFRIEDAHDTDVNSVSWNPRFPVLVTAGDDGSIKVWRQS